MPRRLLTGADAFGVLFDNLLGRTTAQIARDVRLYGILYDRLVIPDSWLFTNGPLQEELSTDQGRELLRQGVLVAARRDNEDSFVGVHAALQARKMFGLCATDEYTLMLDHEASHHVVPYSLKDVGANYVAMARQVLRPPVLMALGVSEGAAAIVDRLIEDAITSGDDWKNNTFVKDQVCSKLTGAQDQQMVMDAVRAPYALNLPTLLHTGILCTADFQGDKILAAIQQGQAEVGSLSVESAATESSLFSAHVDDPRIGWLLTVGINSFTGAEVCLFRSSTLRDHYLVALQQFFIAQNVLTWGDLKRKLTDYLSDGLDLVTRQRELHVQEVGARISVDSALHVHTEDQVIELKGLPQSSNAGGIEGMHAAVAIVGRTLRVPTEMVQPA